MNLAQIIADNKPAQNYQELEAALNRLLPLAPKVILEIGLFQCGLFRVLNQVFQPELLIGVDDTGEPLKWTDGLGDEAIILAPVKSQEQATYDRVVDALEERWLDLLVIDGGHTFVEVGEDFRMYSRLVRDGGVVFMHDIAVPDNDPSFCEVQRFWKSIRDGYKYEEIIHGVGTGLIFWERSSG